MDVGKRRAITITDEAVRPTVRALTDRGSTVAQLGEAIGWARWQP